MKHMTAGAAAIALLLVSCGTDPVTAGPTGSRGAIALAVAGRTVDLAQFCNGGDDGDDTACLQQWVEAGRVSPQGRLFAPAGTYLNQQALPVYSGLKLTCAGPAATTFRNNGGSGLFLTAGAPVSNVRIENCGFDVNGSQENFLTVLDVSPDDPEPSTNIVVRGNRIYDSTIPGQTPDSQRQYILLLNCHDCIVIANHLTEGGRIKLGRPGRALVIRDNIVEHANDNAITVVDGGAGTSEDIRIEGNIVLNPLAIGIFFGADGEDQTSPLLTTRNVLIEDNHIEGNWGTACILGTLPAITDRVHINHNTCVKTGPNAQGSAGIAIKRTTDAGPRATNIRIERNTVLANLPPESDPALDHGGVAFSGHHSGVRVVQNEIRNVGPRAMYFRPDVDIVDARILGNTLVGGFLVIEGSVQGVVQP